MPKQNLASMSVETLLKLKDDVAEALSRRADELKMQLTRLTGAEWGSSRAGRGGRKGALHGKVPPKYRDPKSGATWSGRGAPAKWLAVYEKEGRKRDEFLIANSSRTATARGRAARKKSRRKHR